MSRAHDCRIKAGEGISSRASPPELHLVRQLPATMAAEPRAFGPARFVNRAWGVYHLEPNSHLAGVKGCQEVPAMEVVLEYCPQERTHDKLT